ncbi:MAG: hypothetical protein HW416_1781 [Chloroflexi bacterium]|nr:hypothetical protein [Chloroflexota bacterium]
MMIAIRKRGELPLSHRSGSGWVGEPSPLDDTRVCVVVGKACVTLRGETVKWSAT